MSDKLQPVTVLRRRNRIVEEMNRVSSRSRMELMRLTQELCELQDRCPHAKRTDGVCDDCGMHRTEYEWELAK